MVVRAPICPVYAQPDPQSPLADEALCGMTVEVLDSAGDGFYHIRTHYGYEGFAPAECLCHDPDWEALPQKIVFHKTTCDVLAQPRFSAPCLCTLPLGARVAPVGEAQEGWQQVALPGGERGYVRASCLGPCYATPPALPAHRLRRCLTNTAQRYCRAQYRWGGKTPLGVDCSGLVSMSYLLWGIVIFRDARMEPGYPIRPIPLEAIAPADLLYFKGHVAMYLGEGRYIHSTGKAGSDGVVINSLDPAAPDYRPDLAQGILQVGSYF